jgi:NADH-quinone oxidoreductase subunit J
MVEIVFYVFAASAILSALMCITQRNPVASAFWLISTMLALAGIFVLLEAHFIAAVQVLVYAGAIMVLFLFVIMLLNLSGRVSDIRGKLSWVVAAVIAVALAASLITLRGYTPERLAEEVTGSSQITPDVAFQSADLALAAAESRGVIGVFAEPLFGTYLVPFEITGLLLLTAIVGAVVLAKRRL